MEKAHYDIVLFVLVTSVLILLMAGFIVTILYLYRKKQLAHYKAIEELKLDYEKNLLHTQLEMQEQTFQHISREIHDNITLSLTLAKLNLYTFDWNSVTKAKHQVKSALDQISKAITDLSDISKGLNTELITHAGLTGALEKETNRLKQLELFELEYNITGTPVFMDAQKELVIFRIIQEAFNNIIKHAKATSVHLNLDYTSDHINVFIADDGKGFCKMTVDENREMELKAGITNMQKRAALFNGQTIIESQLDVGTSIRVIIPY